MSANELLHQLAETAQTIEDIEWLDARVAKLADFALAQSEALLSEASHWTEVA